MMAVRPQSYDGLLGGVKQDERPFAEVDVHCACMVDIGSHSASVGVYGRAEETWRGRAVAPEQG